MNAIDTALNYSKSIEVDLESDLFKINRKSSLLKPKQCYCCLYLFTPENEEDNFCSKCKKEGFMEEDIKLKECETTGCMNTVKGKKRFCSPCVEKRYQERQKNRSYVPRKKKEVPDIPKKIPPPLKKEISTTDSTFEKMIKGTFFTFENEVVSITFKMSDGDSFTISR